MDLRFRPSQSPEYTANLRTKNMDFRGLDSNIILLLRGEILMSTEFPGSLESTNLSRDNLSGEIGRTGVLVCGSAVVAGSHGPGRRPPRWRRSSAPTELV